MDLRDKAIVITGASSGIGEALARLLAARGAKLALIARRADRLAEVAARVEAAGGEALALPVDVRDEPALVAAFDRVVERFGGLHALVNNAGLGLDASLHDGATEAWRTMWEVNVLALAVATREALRRFDPAAPGHIVHLGSMAGHRVPPGGGSGFYAATKFAVRALTEGLRQELRARGSPVRVTAISPGYTRTGFFDVYHAGDDERVAETLSHLRMLDPEDVARAAIHALEAPAHVEIHDVLLRPTEQPA